MYNQTKVGWHVFFGAKWYGDSSSGLSCQHFRILRQTLLQTHSPTHRHTHPHTDTHTHTQTLLRKRTHPHTDAFGKVFLSFTIAKAFRSRLPAFYFRASSFQLLPPLLFSSSSFSNQPPQPPQPYHFPHLTLNGDLLHIAWRILGSPLAIDIEFPGLLLGSPIYLSSLTI